MSELAVYGNEEFRTHQIVHKLNFFLAGVTGNVYAVALFVNNLRTQLIQMVDSTGNQLFIARNRRSGNNYRIARHNVHLFMVAHSHAGQGAHRLALAAGGNNNDLVRSIVMRFVNIDNLAVGSLQIA